MKTHVQIFDVGRGPSSKTFLEDSSLSRRARRRQKVADWEARDAGPSNNPAFGKKVGTHKPLAGRMTADQRKVIGVKKDSQHTEQVPEYTEQGTTNSAFDVSSHVTMPYMTEPRKVLSNWRARVESNPRVEKTRDAGAHLSTLTVHGETYSCMRLSRHFGGRVVFYQEHDGSVTAVTWSSVCRFLTVNDIPRSGTAWLRWWIGTPPAGHGSDYVLEGSLGPSGSSRLSQAVFLHYFLQGKGVGGRCCRLVCPSSRRGWLTCAEIVSQGVVMPEEGVFVSRLPGFVHLSLTGGDVHFNNRLELIHELESTPNHLVGEGKDSVYNSFLRAKDHSEEFFRNEKYDGPVGLRERPKYMLDLDTGKVEDAPPPPTDYEGFVNLYVGNGGSGKTSAVCELLKETPVVLVVPKMRLVSSNPEIKDMVMQRVHQSSGAAISMLGKGLKVVDIVTYDEAVGRQFEYPVLVDDAQRLPSAGILRDLVTRSHGGLFVTYGLGQTPGWSNIYEVCQALPPHTEVDAYDGLTEELFRSSLTTVEASGLTQCVVPAHGVFLRVLFGVSGPEETGHKLASTLGYFHSMRYIHTNPCPKRQYIHFGYVDEVSRWLFDAGNALGVDMDYFNKPKVDERVYALACKSSLI